jgi:hypothetical protein
MGALAVPVAAGLPQGRSLRDGPSLLVYDPGLEAGQRFAAAGQVHGAEVLPVDGDRVRFARALFERKPAIVSGVTRWADALMIEEVGRETGYRSVAVLRRVGLRRCLAQDHPAPWPELCRVADAAGDAWMEALAEFAAKPDKWSAPAIAQVPLREADTGNVTGWVIAPQA